MPIDVTVRHMVVSAALQKYVRASAQEILDGFPAVMHIHVILDTDARGRKMVAEVVAHTKRHGVRGARADGESWRGTVDTAFDRIERQLRKLEEKKASRRKL